MLPTRFLILLCFTGLLLTTAGCSLFRDQTGLEKTKEKVELKKKQFAALYEKLSEGQITNGAQAAQIKNSYGEPDDVFRSGSTESKVEVWTYERIMTDKDDEDWHPITLYFENNRLISWKY